MNYQQTLDYMYARLPMFSRVGSDAVKSGFANITALCEILENPHQKGKFIHVAGTNGKGSVSHMLAAVLHSAGYKTGLYTSPHLKDFRERIKINGKMIDESRVVDFIEKIKPLIESIQPSFFEITVAMAFDHFVAEGTDIAIIETGLGGRLDSTNIINPVLSVITNIGWDHVQILGDTLEKIAGEKAGIIKPQVPVILGEKKEATESVFIEKAATAGSALFFAGDHYHVENWMYEDEMLLVEVSEQGKTDHRKYSLDLTGQYQIKNLVTVLESCRQLRAAGYNLPEEAIVQGLKHVKKQTGLHGRWETIQHNPRIVLDVAHNESGMQELLNQLEISTYHQLHIILGMVKDKDVDTVLHMLPLNAIYYFTNAHIPRALDAAALKDKAALRGLSGHVFENVNMAIAAAKSHAHNDDLILVCGSVFLVGEVKC
ncbi:MAG TPA: folylpolyglutamate synthase/dihydrofolate synthase family protein [Niabella sp.]|nr:folylpolyglutamate synthase/dihydrofolate synthase family protein [Niabella sp.]